MNAVELTAELLRHSVRLDSECDQLSKLTQEWAAAESDYRKRKAEVYLSSEGTVDARRAQVDLECEAERYAAHLAEGLMNAAKERVRATMAQLSAIQTARSAHTAELRLSSTG